VILINNQTYGAVRRIAEHMAKRSGAVLRDIELPFPARDADAIVAAFEAGLTPKTKLAVLDHVTSPTAVVMPVERMVAACRAAGVRVLVDGAHTPGMIPLDLTGLDADWYTGNCHKWLCAPKGSAFLWARADVQADLHSTVISHGYGSGFLAEFDWTGTRDPTPYLAVDACLEFRERFGDDRIMRHNHWLAVEAGQRLARLWRTEVGNAGSLTGSMAMVRLPAGFAGDSAAGKALRQRLWETARIEVPVNALTGHLWVRISAQLYNEMADYERLGEAILRM
jgi:isopenicillin-N epimerase